MNGMEDCGVKDGAFRTGAKLLLCVVMTMVLSLSLNALNINSPAEAADPSDPGHFIERTDRFFAEAFDSYIPTIHRAATRLFFLLFLCQFAWSIIQLMLEDFTSSASFARVFTTVTRQILVGMFFYWFLLDHTILETIIDSFIGLSGHELSFGHMLRIWGDAMHNLGVAIHEKGGFSITGLGTSIMLAITGLLTSVILSYTMMVGLGLLAVVKVEQYVASSLGLILLGFGGADITREYTLSYIKLLVHIGLKQFLLMVIIFVGATTFADSTAAMADLDGLSLLQECFRLIAQCIFFAVIVKTVPGIADTLMRGVSTDTRSLAFNLRSGEIATMGYAAGLAMAVYNTPRNVRSGIEDVKTASTAFSSEYRERKSAYQSRYDGIGSGSPLYDATTSSVALGVTAAHTIGRAFGNVAGGAVQYAYNRGKRIMEQEVNRELGRSHIWQGIPHKAPQGENSMSGSAVNNVPQSTQVTQNTKDTQNGKDGRNAPTKTSTVPGDSAGDIPASDNDEGVTSDDESSGRRSDQNDAP